MTLDLRKIDALVAEHVFGCHVQTSGPSPTCGCDRLGTYPFGFPHGDGRGEYATELKRYSAYISDAWEIVQSLNLASVSEFRLSQDYEGLWGCYISWADEGESCKGNSFNASTAPLAICMAALKAKGVVL